MSDMDAVRSFYYLGDYHKCVSLLLSIRQPTTDRQLFLYRAYLRQKKITMAINTLKHDIDPQVSHVLIEYFDGENDQILIKALEQRFQKPSRYAKTGEADASPLLSDDIDPNLLLVCIEILCSKQETMKALVCVDRYIAKDSSSSETLTLELLYNRIHLAQILNLTDLVARTVKRMQTIDSEASLSQMALGLNLLTSQDPPSIRRALGLYRDLSERYGQTSVLLNNEAVCMALLDDEYSLEKVLAVLRKGNQLDGSDVNVAYNLAALLPNDEGGDAYWEELISLNPKPMLVQQVLAKQEEFENCCKDFNK
ncbi:hypothetical protein ACOME3_005612 [Neoechinorhynchus agilis]